LAFSEAYSGPSTILGYELDPCRPKHRLDDLQTSRVADVPPYFDV
jgi:hypothetical protein